MMVNSFTSKIVIQNHTIQLYFSVAHVGILPALNMTDLVELLKEGGKILASEDQRNGKINATLLDVWRVLFNKRRILQNPADQNNSGQSALGRNTQINLPNFFIVGAAKAGTSSLANILGAHPEIYISPIKEPHFFCDDIRLANFRKDYRESSSFDVTKYLRKHPLPHKHIAFIEDAVAYLDLFREVTNENALGELSTGYLYSNTAAENLRKFNPDSKIVMVLRQPVERAYSHYLMNLREWWDSNSNFIDALERDFASPGKGWGTSHLYVELGLYFEQVSRYLKRFPESQVKIYLYEDFTCDPVKFIRELCTFLEVDPSALSTKNIVAELENVAALPRYKISGAYLPILNALKRHIGTLLPGKTKTWVRNMMLSSSNIPKLRKDEFEQAMKYFSDDIEKLSVLIKRDLQSWRQTSN